MVTSDTTTNSARKLTKSIRLPAQADFVSFILQQKTPVDVHRGCIYNDLIGRGKLRYYPCFCAVAFNASLATITISTRRLAARPASVSLSAIGSAKPLPMVTNLDDGTP